MKKQPCFSIIYEDNLILGVNKASGIPVSAVRWDNSGERLDKMLNALYAGPEGTPAGENKPPFFSRRVFTVHRIDQDTSGIVIFAKDRETHKRLSNAFESRLVTKRYVAVIHGRPSWKEAACDLPLAPDGDARHRTIIDKYQGKKSLTRFRLLGSAGNYGVIEALPETGRTHQIRVHLAALGHPVACDPLYGNLKPVFLSSFKRGWRGDPLKERPLLARLGLHAASLVLPGCRGDPGTGGSMTLQAPLPRDMAALIKQMGKSAGGFSWAL
ncbi:MAG: RNA pseudouridine synthase [Treponema sp.]|jgi:23S rRNA pseudouridine1911/1915/1917 synthase|nr:RNA pseudouridine synthase [Treponema sp.]